MYVRPRGTWIELNKFAVPVMMKPLRNGKNSVPVIQEVAEKTAMFEQTRPKSSFHSALAILELVYHSIVRDVRKAHGNAIMSILVNMLQAAIFVLAF